MPISALPAALRASPTPHAPLPMDPAPKAAPGPAIWAPFRPRPDLVPPARPAPARGASGRFGFIREHVQGRFFSFYVRFFRGRSSSYTKQMGWEVKTGVSEAIGTSHCDTLL